MLHPPVCGPGELEARQAGFLTFPQLLAPGLGPRGQVECVWDLAVRPNKQISIQVTILETFPLILQMKSTLCSQSALNNQTFTVSTNQE